MRKRRRGGRVAEIRESERRMKQPVGKGKNSTRRSVRERKRERKRERE